MEQFSADKAEPEDAVRIWRPQASMLAGKSKTPDPVGKFLESKGIPQNVASEAAIEIWNEAQKSRIKSDIPRLVIGWGLILLAVGISTFTIFWHGRFIIISLGPAALGAAVLWGGYLTQGSE